MSEFTHLHVHSEYSILDGAAKMDNLLGTAKKLGMNSIALTDHGNMFGAMDFLKTAKKHDIKPILGCEIYVSRDSRTEKVASKGRNTNHLILLAKNYEGYLNLSKMVSLGYTEGFYFTPRIDKELLRKYSKGIIASSACLGGELPQAVLKHGKDRAQEVVEEFKEIFGDDYYIELQNHGLAEQVEVNKVLIELAKENDVKLIAANDVHFVEKDDFDAHKILICLNTGKDLDDPAGLMYSGHEYLKSPEEMMKIFEEIPEAVSNTQDIVDKVEVFSLEREVLLPNFPIPEDFEDQNAYIEHLTYEGASERYPELSDEIKARLEMELGIVKSMGFAGYFLIVQDFIAKAREMGVLVGPGRGSAAGSAIAYCLKITNIDPIKYKLLFERFLNPERISMPDIDVDFDDEGRGKVLDYVVEKYGQDKVAQIITFGRMASRSSIRDVARVLKLDLQTTDRIAKMVPSGPDVSLEKAFKAVPDLRKMAEGNDELIRRTLHFAKQLENSNRSTGIHACGVIIAPDSVMNFIPVARSKETKLNITQFEGKVVENAGMLKMDFLGLKTLSIIQTTIRSIKESHGVEINIDNIPLDDAKTFELYQKGDTIGTFQFESEGMRQYLKDLKPTDIEDLIAMNALYRPGPMQYIPTYVNRKHGKEKVEYPHPMLEEILKDTNGIMVYQEQIMQTATRMGGFTLGKADILRKAMGKKKMDVMEKEMVNFIKGAEERGVLKNQAIEVWETMKKFAEYGFNRSHSAAYSIISYQTAYLKAHYPAEFMAANLTHNLNDIVKIHFFIDEGQRMGLTVLGPDINESDINFKVNKNGQLRFGMGGIKGVGSSAAAEIIRERGENGDFKDIFDLTKRVNLRTVNKKTLEALAKAGGFDSFESTHRAQYFYQDTSEDPIFLEKIIKHGGMVQQRELSMQQSLFGGSDEMVIENLKMPECERWSKVQKLKSEREMIGFYISGHPLDQFKLEADHYFNTSISQINHDLKSLLKREIRFGGMLTSVGRESKTKTGKPFCQFVIEDYTESKQFVLFGEKYLEMQKYLIQDSFVMVSAKVQMSTYRENNIEIDIRKMEPLFNLLEKNPGKIYCELDVKDVDDEMIKGLKSVLDNHKGNNGIHFILNDKGNELKVKLLSTSARVEAKGALKELQSIKGVKSIYKRDS